MTFIKDIDGFGGSAPSCSQEKDSKMCQLVLEVYTQSAISKTGRRQNLKDLSEQQVRDQFALAIVDEAMKPLTDYLTTRGFYYQLNVQEGKVFIPNAPRSLARDVFKNGIEGIVKEVSTLQPGQTFHQVLDFDGVKLY